MTNTWAAVDMRTQAYWLALEKENMITIRSRKFANGSIYITHADMHVSKHAAQILSDQNARQKGDSMNLKIL